MEQQLLPTLAPQEIVAELDKYIVGQAEAKRAVAVALRNRERRRHLPEELRKEIMPKNILMIGPTGVGKTEIARRVAQMIKAPFVKVEATRFTEVGYVGRDVEAIIRDLVENAVETVHDEQLLLVREKAEAAAAQRIVDYLCQQYPHGPISKANFRPQREPTPLWPPIPTGTSTAATGMASGPGLAQASEPARAEAVTPTPQARPMAPSLSPQEQARLRQRRRRVARLLAKNKLEEAAIEIELPSENDSMESILEFGPDMSLEEMNESFQDFVARYQAQVHKRRRRVSVQEARRLLLQEESEKLIDYDEMVETATQRASELGVVFIDELDKIVGPRVEVGADVSGEGVQRDLLPIVDGTTVMTRYGPVSTDHILFIAAGSFYEVKPSDLIPELQGRFPLRVELERLTQEDFVRILTEPQNALTRQYQALLSTEGVNLVFTPDALEEMARLASLMNERSEDIGARRLQTIIEKTLEDLSFNASQYRGQTIMVDKAFVVNRLANLVQNEDLSRYIL